VRCTFKGASASQLVFYYRQISSTLRPVDFVEMHNYAFYAFLLISAFVVYVFANSYLTNHRHARRAGALGCKPPRWRPYRWPLGTDMLWSMIQADKAQVLPDEFVRVANELGVSTWEQSLFGDPSFVTTDPKNIQAILATQFSDFEIGEVRRKNFFPLLGNGIFTTDGKNW
jgi:hypothetical protein